MIQLVKCNVCGLRKHPIGRDVGAAAGNSYCGYDCDGYTADPHPGYFWPGENENNPCNETRTELD